LPGLAENRIEVGTEALVGSGFTIKTIHTGISEDLLLKEEGSRNRATGS
jgi:hypothetical protein